MAKINGNRARDLRVERKLELAGWRVAKVWECAIRDTSEAKLLKTMSRLATWVRSKKSRTEIRGLR